jgi:hypothetical protein
LRDSRDVVQSVRVCPWQTDERRSLPPPAAKGTPLPPRIPRDPTNPAYQLIPDDMLSVIPRLYATEQIIGPEVYVKIFTPDSNWQWLVVEFDPEQRLCFGLVKGLETELGYLSLAQLEEVRGPLGLANNRREGFGVTSGPRRRFQPTRRIVALATSVWRTDAFWEPQFALPLFAMMRPFDAEFPHSGPEGVRIDLQ